MDKEYAGIAGVPEFTAAAGRLAYGQDATEVLARTAIVQSLSGTGALRLGGAFLQRFQQPARRILLPTPTWGNHGAIFRDAGLEVAPYRYFCARTLGLDLDGLLADLQAAPPGTAVLLHACAHNPTGVDPSAAQWRAIAQVVRARRLLPFFDMAYQGFASGDAERDAQAVRAFVDAGAPLLLAQSFAKNFGLYGERVGALSVVCADAQEAQAVLSQLKILVRPMYSNPPIHGARIVGRVLSDPPLAALWAREVAHMAQRIMRMRSRLRDLLLHAHRSSRSWAHITDQIGMFAYTGLLPEQVLRLTRDHHVYLTNDGRISIAGITDANVEHLAHAIHSVTK